MLKNNFILASITTLFINSPVFSEQIKQLELGFAFYVGGLHVLDAKAHLIPQENNKYIFTTYATTRGFTNWTTGFMGKSTSQGILNKDLSVKAQKHTNISTSYFGDNYSELSISEKGVKLIRYPDYSEKEIANLEGNPLAKANDPVATLINTMIQVANTKQCAKDLVIIANHFLYKMHILKAKTVTLPTTEYNISHGEVISCDLGFIRLDKQKNLSAYNALNQKSGKKDRSPTVYFKKFNNIPYALPVLIRATEKNFGEFYMHLQYVKYGDIVINSPIWDDSNIISKETKDTLQAIPKKLMSN